MGRIFHHHNPTSSMALGPNSFSPHGTSDSEMYRQHTQEMLELGGFSSEKQEIEHLKNCVALRDLEIAELKAKLNPVPLPEPATEGEEDVIEVSRGDTSTLQVQDWSSPVQTQDHKEKYLPRNSYCQSWAGLDAGTPLLMKKMAEDELKQVFNTFDNKSVEFVLQLKEWRKRWERFGTNTNESIDTQIKTWREYSDQFVSAINISLRKDHVTRPPRNEPVRDPSDW